MHNNNTSVQAGFYVVQVSSFTARLQVSKIIAIVKLCRKQYFYTQFFTCASLIGSKKNYFHALLSVQALPITKHPERVMVCFSVQSASREKHVF